MYVANFSRILDAIDIRDTHVNELHVSGMCTDV